MVKTKKSGPQGSARKGDEQTDGPFAPAFYQGPKRLGTASAETLTTERELFGFVFSWRRGSELNRRIKVLQTFALPLGYRADRGQL